MGLFLGIDGGGTKTEVLVCDEEGRIRGRGIAGPSNPLFIKKKKLFETIRESIGMATRNCGEEIKFDYAAICIPGIRKYENDIIKEYFNNSKKTGIFGDDLNAFYGAVAKPYGIVVVSGTGSFVIGINRKCEICELGGWGPILGDEGSGYYIGISCLKSVINEYEGAGEKTVLTSKVKDFFRVNEIPNLRRVIYSKECDRSTISSLSKIVHESALEGDIISLEIINDAAKHLAVLVNRVIKRLNMFDGKYEAVLTGGISNFGMLMLEPFSRYVRKSSADISIKKPRFKPVVGSLLIAMKESGIDINNEEIMSNIRDSYNKLLIN